jgi:hypothetical protein
MNKPLENTEKELDQLLENNKTIKANWSCELVDEWLKEPKSGLTFKQKKYIQALTDKIKVYSLKK